jgi:uncharacterized iron-regulated membrane protein
MKLKGLGNRAYNVLFHTHTVAGIVISFALFVIFYAGAFSLFRHEIGQWENPDMRQNVSAEHIVDKALEKVDSVYNLNFHEVTNVNFPSKQSPVVYVYGAVNNTDSTTERMAAYVSPSDMRVQDIRDEPLTTVGETIYRLHYFRQIPVVGIYIAGFVALFFLFSVITGLLIHWRNLFTKFYAFVKEGKWRVIWTNAHTVLGVIGLPFQVIYAVTGAFFGLLTLILLPSVLILYGGDSTEVFKKVQPQQGIVVDKDAPLSENISLSELSIKIKHLYPNFHITRAQLRNYGREDAVVSWQIDDDKGISSPGTISMRMSDAEILDEYSIFPNDKTYSNSVTDYLFKLHFANFGGLIIKVLYFVLSIITCFMIISGILIWRTARDNGQYTLKQRLFHHKVTKWYLSICLSMFPAFTIIFLTNKLVPMEMVGRVSLVNSIFFLSWLGLTILGYFWERYAQQNRNFLIIGGFLSLLIPLTNGIVTGGWIWDMWGQYPSVVFIDLFWLSAGVVSLYLSFFVLKVKASSDRPQAIVPKSSDKSGNGRAVSKPKLKPQMV